MDQSSETSAANYTVKYNVTLSIEGATTPYKARLITAQESAYSFNSNFVWFIHGYGLIYNDVSVSRNNIVGVRPVITVLKSKLL